TSAESVVRNTDPAISMWRLIAIVSGRTRAGGSVARTARRSCSGATTAAINTATNTVKPTALTRSGRRYTLRARRLIQPGARDANAGEGGARVAGAASAGYCIRSSIRSTKFASDSGIAPNSGVDLSWTPTWWPPSAALRFAERVAWWRAHRFGRRWELATIDPPAEVGRNRGPVRALAERGRCSRMPRGGCPKIRDLELGDGPDLLGCIRIGHECEKPIGNCTLGHPLQGCQLGRRRRSRIPRRRNDRVDHFIEREWVCLLRRESNHSRRTLALEDGIHDHLGQRARCSELIECRTRSATEQLGRRLIGERPRTHQTEDRVGDRQLRRRESAYQLMQCRALLRSGQRARLLLPVPTYRVCVFHPADRLCQ